MLLYTIIQPFDLKHYPRYSLDVALYSNYFFLIIVREILIFVQFIVVKVK